MIKQKYRKCKICEHIGGIFVTRKDVLADGTVKITQKRNLKKQILEPKKRKKKFASPSTN